MAFATSYDDGGGLLRPPPSFSSPYVPFYDVYVTRAWDDWQCGILLHYMLTKAVRYPAEEIVGWREKRDAMTLKTAGKEEGGIWDFSFVIFVILSVIWQAIETLLALRMSERKFAEAAAADLQEAGKWAKVVEADLQRFAKGTKIQEDADLQQAGKETKVHGAETQQAGKRERDHSQREKEKADVCSPTGSPTDAEVMSFVIRRLPKANVKVDPLSLSDGSELAAEKKSEKTVDLLFRELTRESGVTIRNHEGGATIVDQSTSTPCFYRYGSILVEEKMFVSYC